MRLETTYTDEHGDLWHYFTDKAEAEAASVNGYVLETSPHTIWRTVVRRDEAPPPF